MTKPNIPRSLGMILDGNRRYAKENNLPVLEGHRLGAEKVKDIVKWCFDAGIEEVIFYAFSTENWNRSPEEVSALMNLFGEFFETASDVIIEKGGRLRFIGERERFSPRLQEKMREVEEKTKHGTKGTLVVALSYGGRAEILAAVNTLLSSGIESVAEDMFKEAMWSAELLDPDIIIRTGGEKRLSNFLPWQSVYSELFFTGTKLPAFTKEEFESILQAYAKRERRHGR